jgi:hypothetical protein
MKLVIINNAVTASLLLIISVRNRIVSAIKEHPDHSGRSHCIQDGALLPKQVWQCGPFAGNDVDPVETSEARSVTCFPVACRCRSTADDSNSAS